jgi:hypothetical protein
LEVEFPPNLFEHIRCCLLGRRHAGGRDIAAGQQQVWR